MTNHTPIDPGPDCVTVFKTGPRGTEIQTYHRTDKDITRLNNIPQFQEMIAPPENTGAQPDRLHPKRSEQEKPTKIGWVIHVPGASEDKDSDSGWELRWPHVGEFTVARSFESIEKVRDAIPQITQFASTVKSLHPKEPHFILMTQHVGTLDPANVMAITDNLYRAGARATLVVDHGLRSG
jgi:hypothetical protein